MDTDNLSNETYRAIMTESKKFNHDLTLQFGLLADECNDEEEYIDKSILLINELKNAGREDLEDIFFETFPSLTRLNKTFDKILDNIAKVKQIPIEKRNYDFE
ncbi:MAG: hypothetical protein RO257_04950 [Candidatus Kapabacteria bacterium]|jgi:hypothetical protein|nr:hypothetical protein [Candidatus Kapabacteria bacterium]